MINFSGLNNADEDDSEPPARKEIDYINLLFGQKEDLEVEGQVRTDDHLQLILFKMI